MNNLIIINENITNGYKDEILNIFYLFIILFGIFVIVTKNPVISVLFLIGLFSTVACYLIMIGLKFIGLSYIIVYVGAVSILFLFILMLINIRVSELKNDTSNSLPLILTVLILFSYPLFQLLPYNPLIWNNSNNFFINLEVNIKDLLYVSSKIWDRNLAEANHMTAIGSIIYTNYNLWLIISSFILLLAMVGAIVITIKQNNSN